MEMLKFEPELIEGILIKRVSQFTMSAIVDGQTERCHCCTSETIGNIDLYGRPCLLSVSTDKRRNTSYTVEALSLNVPEETDKEWIGINQIASNKYVEHFIRTGQFNRMVNNQMVRREQQFRDSKIDFLLQDAYLEVKTPLQNLQTYIPYHVHTKPVSHSARNDRLIRHLDTLVQSLQDHPRAILLLCFMYDNPGFQILGFNKSCNELRSAIYRSTLYGVEIWQANFRLMPDGVILDRYFQIDPDIFNDSYRTIWF